MSTLPLTPIAQSYLLGQLSPEMAQLAARGVITQFPKKTVVVAEGDEGSSLFILLQGSVKVISIGRKKDQEIRFATVETGDLFGEMSMDGGTRGATVVALEPCVCAVVSYTEVRNHLNAYPEFTMMLVSRLIRRTREATNMVRNLAFADVYQRLVSTLESLKSEDSSLGTHSNVILKSHLDISKRVGASREMITRLLNDLQKGGYIEMHTKRIVLLKKLPDRW